MYNKFIVWETGKFTMSTTGLVVLSVSLRRAEIRWALSVVSSLLTISLMKSSIRSRLSFSSPRTLQAFSNVCVKLETAHWLEREASNPNTEPSKPL